MQEFGWQEKKPWMTKKSFGQNEKGAGIGTAENSCETQRGTQYLNRYIGYSWGAALSQQTH